MAISVPLGDYQAPVDIANRALQLLGARRISTFQDTSKNALSVSFVYDKLRKAELRRNVWVFSTRLALLRPIDSTVLELIPQAYNAVKTYIVGSVVSFNNHVYIAMAQTTAGQQPDQNPGIWSAYFGPMTVTLWSNTGTSMGLQLWASSTTYGAGAQVIGSDGNEYQSLINSNVGNNPISSPLDWQLLGVAPGQGPGYFSGEIVYTPASASYAVYLSLTSANSDVPGVIPAWNSATTYNKGAVVSFSAANWQSTEDLNLNNTPGVSGWVSIPATQTDSMTGSNWLQLNATLKSIQLVYPLGSGPVTQLQTRNIYQLPNGYLREAAQNPKQGAATLWGAETGNPYNDWDKSDNFIVTRQFSPIVYRFCADVVDVTKFDPMFCEGLAARIAMECCEEITQALDKMQALASLYKKVMDEARTVNGIEVGDVEQAVDDYIACRA